MFLIKTQMLFILFSLNQETSHSFYDVRIGTYDLEFRLCLKNIK